MHTTHLLISTGQNISNFVPLLQFAEKDDRIIVLESAMARKNDWGKRLIKRLEMHKYQAVKRVDVSDGDLLYPAVLGDIIEKQLDQSAALGLYIYLNGGQKLTVVLLIEILRQFNPRIIYMDSRPVRFWVLDHFSKQTCAEIQPIKYEIDLRDILALYGSSLHAQSASQPVYEKGSFNSDAPGVIGTDFWTEKEFIKTVLSVFYQAYYKQDDGYSPPPEPKIQEIRQIIQSRWNVLPLKNLPLNGNSNKTLVERRMEWSVEFVKSVINKLYFLSPKNQDETSIPVSDRVRSRMIKNKLLKENFYANGVKRSDMQQRLGFYFEDVVLYRVYKFLSARPYIRAVISQIWQNVQVCSVREPELVSGEYDILFVLKNGLLISLECKTNTFETKDAFARLARLTLRGGGQAVQWVTAPFFTQADLFHVPMYKLWENMHALNIPFIPFTMSGQFAKFQPPERDGPVLIAEFEDELEKRFAPFLP